MAFRLVGLAPRRSHGHEPRLAQRVAADQRLVVEYDRPPCNVLRSDDAAGNASRPVAGCGLADFPGYVQPARYVARCHWPLRRRARLAWGALRRAAGLGRSARARAVADRLAGGRLVLAEYSANVGPLAPRL